jgi:SAM-dependent methyltransferase
MNKKLMRWMGAYFLLDGLLTLFFGRKYVRPFRFGRRTSPYRRMIEWLLNLPVWQLRAAGAAEASLGLALLSRAPLDVPGLYRLVAAGYAAIDPGWREWFYPQAHQAFDRALSSGIPQGGTVLDLGCGVGANLARIRAMGLPLGSYSGVDLSTAMLRHAKERYGNIPHVSFRQLDLMSDPLPEGPYDLIISTWVFEHLPDPVRVAVKAWERLKPGGCMLLLFEAQTPSFLSRVIGRIYPFLSAHLVVENEYRRFPGQVILEDHFSGPLGDLALLVLEKPGVPRGDTMQGNSTVIETKDMELRTQSI